MEEETGEQSNNKPWLFKKGQSGNPSGRPKGSKSLKTRAQEMLQTMNDEEFQDFLDGLPKIEIWKMAEGNPESNVSQRIGVMLADKSDKEAAKAAIDSFLHGHTPNIGK